MKPNFPILFSLLLGLALATPVLGQTETNLAEAVETNGSNVIVEQPKPQKSEKRRSSRSGPDRTVVGSELVVAAGEEIKDGVVVAGSAVINGKVNGDLVVVFGHAKLGPQAELASDLVVVGGGAEIDPAARIGGDRVLLGAGVTADMPAFLRWPEQWVYKGLLWGRPLPHQLLWPWVLAGMFLILYLLLALLFPRSVDASVKTLANRPGSSFLTGLLALVVLGPLIFILIVTFIGIVLIPFVLCGIFAAFILGKVAVYRFAGEQLTGQVGLTFLQRPLVALLIGTLLFYLCYTIPFLGFMVWGIIAPLGLGAALLAFFGRLRTETAKPGVGGAAGVAIPSPTVGQAIPTFSDPSILALPRVGFWLRLGATALDLVLVGLVVSLLNLHGPAFIFLWTIYHVGLWAWKGTTIGGMVAGIKIVRTDGGPISLPVAVVRSLASFLSAAVLFLGFFWAGWNAEKQAWHDKIANTLVVRMPKGVAMV